MHQAHPTEDFYNGLHFLFIYSVKLPMLQVSHGQNTELSRFSFFFPTKLWYKFAQFSILLLINLTGAQFVK